MTSCRASRETGSHLRSAGAPVWAQAGQGRQQHAKETTGWDDDWWGDDEEWNEEDGQGWDGELQEDGYGEDLEQSNGISVASLQGFRSTSPFKLQLLRHKEGIHLYANIK